jgi:hypothetical protein
VEVGGDEGGDVVWGHEEGGVHDVVVFGGGGGDCVRSGGVVVFVGRGTEMEGADVGCQELA